MICGQDNVIVIAEMKVTTIALCLRSSTPFHDAEEDEFEKPILLNDYACYSEQSSYYTSQCLPLHNSLKILL